MKKENLQIGDNVSFRYDKGITLHGQVNWINYFDDGILVLVGNEVNGVSYIGNFEVPASRVYPTKQ